MTCHVCLAPPRLLQEAKTVHTYLEGEEVSLPCIVEGTPPLSIVWLLDGVDIEDLKLPNITTDEDTELKENNIILVKVCWHASLIYQCLQTSCRGMDTLKCIAEQGTKLRNFLFC